MNNEENNTYDGGYYMIEYNYRDKRGHLLTRKLMRGTFDLIVKAYKELMQLVKDKDRKAPIKKPYVYKVVKGENIRIDFKEEYEKWRNSKLNTKK